ncbi:hypothetical protein KUV26_07785 [Leisingera daeponensis]|uniref:Uncharacterized protein n=1 Tax=Leisingera daeponensis TaxID=405746 RepID=A0ABS7NDP7_9RHOB|nr:hypothetical protein [Leisingera daeponensis]MBY6139336.1 hypothetical protein [Leisingera daeponensis]
MTDDLPATRTEVFRYTDELGNEKLLAVAPLRRWAESNCDLKGIPIDVRKVEDMFENEKIDQEHLRRHTMTRDPRPIIVCENFRGMASEIVDGNHTYAAMATAVALAERSGMRLPMEPTVPGYVITRAQMERFLLPPEVLLPSSLADN